MVVFVIIRWSGEVGCQVVLLFFCSAFIDYIKGRFEAIKDIYSPYQIKLHLSSCLLEPSALSALDYT